MKTVRANLQKLMGEKGQREHRRISLRTVANETKLTRYLIYGMDAGTVQCFPKNALVVLCDYFNCTPGELLTLEDVPDDPAAPA